MPYSPMAIANEFIKRSGPHGLTQMQLQKLTYIAHGWNLVVNGEPLVHQEPRAWDYGPVYPELYEHVKFFGSKPITRLIRDSDTSPFSVISDSPDADGNEYTATLDEFEAAVIDHVWNKYGSMDAFKLSSLTHQPSTPWYITFFRSGKNAKISNDLIESHYVELINSNRVASS